MDKNKSDPIVSYGIPKRFRREDGSYIPNRHDPWQKNILDLEKRKLFGRTKKRWAIGAIFYICFYIVVAVITAICWTVFWKQLSKTKPHLQKLLPSLSFSPAPFTKKYPLQIDYSMAYDVQIDKYCDAIEDTLFKYGDGSALFSPCRPENDFGFKKGEPCVFLKINRVYGFKLVSYDSASDLPDKAPGSLKNYINSINENERMNNVWISCHTKEDGVKFQYIPRQHVASKYLEFDELVYYKPISAQCESSNTFYYDRRDFNRIIAVKLTGIPFNKTFEVECQLWAKNIKNDQEDNGFVFFFVNVKEN